MFSGSPLNNRFFSQKCILFKHPRPHIWQQGRSSCNSTEVDWTEWLTGFFPSCYLEVNDWKPKYLAKYITCRKVLNHVAVKKRKKLLSICLTVYATTAANPRESSYACYYDDERQTYLGDWYSVNWMEDSDMVSYLHEVSAFPCMENHWGF